MAPDLRRFSRVAYSTYGMILKTYELTVDVIKHNVPGALVECGVAAGAQIGVMAHVCKEMDPDREIHLFDSFEGIPLAGPKDEEQPGIGKITHNVNVSSEELLVSSGITVCSLEEVKKNIDRWGFSKMNIHYHKGWFQHTVPNNKIDKIAILRLDGDLYESTKVCLDHLGNKVQKGGFIIVDDYALAGARKAVLEYFAENNLEYELVNIYEGVEGGKNDDPNQLAPVYWQVR